MAMQTPQDLFKHELGDIYDAEQTIAGLLSTLAGEVEDQDVRSALQQHEQETRRQIQNLDQCFQIIGAPQERVVCTAIRGLKQEHDTFIKENPSKSILTMFDLGGAAKTEHYEIAAYRDLVEQANLLGQRECARLLQENLKQEERMAQRVEQLSKQIGQQMMQRMGQMGQMGQQPGQQPRMPG